MRFRLAPNESSGSSGSISGLHDRRGQIAALPTLAKELRLLLPAGTSRSSFFEWRENSLLLPCSRGLGRLEKRVHSQGQFSSASSAPVCSGSFGSSPATSEFAELNAVRICGAKHREMNTCAKMVGGYPEVTNPVFRSFLISEAGLCGNLVLARIVTRSVEWRPPRTGQAKRIRRYL
jgi:hypothetical protein